MTATSSHDSSRFEWPSSHLQSDISGVIGSRATGKP